MRIQSINIIENEKKMEKIGYEQFMYQNLETKISHNHSKHIY